MAIEDLSYKIKHLNAPEEHSALGIFVFFLSFFFFLLSEVEDNDSWVGDGATENFERFYITCGLRKEHLLT